MVCVKWNHLNPYKARPRIWGEAAGHVVIYSVPIKLLPFSDSDSRHSNPSLVACVAEQTQRAVGLAGCKSGLFCSRFWGKNLALGLRKRWPLWDSHSSPGCPTLQSSLHSHLSTCEDQRVTAVRAKSCKCASNKQWVPSEHPVKYGDWCFRGFQMKVKQFSCAFTLFLHLSSASVMYLNVSPTRSWK